MKHQVVLREKTYECIPRVNNEFGKIKKLAKYKRE